MLVQTYLFFDGRCEEAVEFYKSALGAEVEFMMRFKDMPQDAAGNPEGCGPQDASDGEKVLHTCFRIGETKVMASDDPTGETKNFEGFSLSITVVDNGEAERVFKALADGGQATMPLAETFFSPSFGMATDRFGVKWMVNVPGEKPAN